VLTPTPYQYKKFPKNKILVGATLSRRADKNLVFGTSQTGHRIAECSQFVLPKSLHDALCLLFSPTPRIC
jgi:hypothetical protein